MMTSESSDGGRAEPLSPPMDDGSPRPSWKAVYTIADRGNGRKHWLRIGVAFVNRDLSLNVRLDAVPVNGQIHIREAPPRDGQGGWANKDEDRPREDPQGGRAAY